MSNIDIDKYINLINNNNDIKGEKCLICHMNDLKKNLIQLNCKHYFHKSCLSNKKKIKCTYCKKKHIFKNQACSEKCSNIIKSGKNKGKICNRINCRYH
tara:strand:- start:733 stop:1029 length:297 start_codon:yes stop_codon:yes gene_type:complete